MSLGKTLSKPDAVSQILYDFPLYEVLAMSKFMVEFPEIGRNGEFCLMGTELFRMMKMFWE